MVSIDGRNTFLILEVVLSSSRRVRMGPGQRPQSAKRQRQSAMAAHAPRAYWVQCEISGQRHAERPRELLCAGRNSAVVTLRTFSRLRCLTGIREHPKVVPKMSSYERQRIPGEVMISDSKDRVSREALLRSEPVPAPWAAKVCLESGLVVEPRKRKHCRSALEAVSG